MNCNAYFYSCLPSSLSHNTKYLGSDTHSGRWSASLFCPSPALYVSYACIHRGIEQIIYKSTLSLTHSNNKAICFFSIIKPALSSCFLLLPWHGDLWTNCIIWWRGTAHLTNILFSFHYFIIHDK